MDLTMEALIDVWNRAASEELGIWITCDEGDAKLIHDKLYTCRRDIRNERWENIRICLMTQTLLFLVKNDVRLVD